MSRFYGEVKGSRGKASRMGGIKSGFWSHIRGWNVGVEVNCHVDEDGKDVITVYRTGGSNGGLSLTRLLTVTEEDRT